MSWSALSVSGHPLSQIRTRTPRSIHTGPPSAVNVPELAMIQNGSPAGRRKANVMANIFIVKLQLSTIVRSLLCALAALAVERRSVTRIRGKFSKCPTSRVLVELRATLTLPPRHHPIIDRWHGGHRSPSENPPHQENAPPQNLPSAPHPPP